MSLFRGRQASENLFLPLLVVLLLLHHLLLICSSLRRMVKFGSSFSQLF
jgi:hypothetical protein